MSDSEENQRSENPEDVSDPDESPSKARFALVDRDRVVLLTCSTIFFLLLAARYAWFCWDNPVALPLDRGAEFQSFRVDINRATWVDWLQLPGIGPTMSDRILGDLDRNGPFQSIDDLTRVPGIGPKTLAQIRPWLTISHDRPTPKP